MSIYDGYKDEEKYRVNLIKTIDKTKYGQLKDICSKLEYALSPYDLIRMSEAYKNGNKKFKEKIEYLLTDMNFHSECAELCIGNVDEVISNSKKEIEKNIEFFLTHVFEKEFERFPNDNGMLPANSIQLSEYTVDEIYFLIEKNILQKRDCDGLAYELTDSYIEKIKEREMNEESEEI